MEGNTFFGEHGLDIWAAGIPWAFVAIMAVKIAAIILKGITWDVFKWRYWFNENLFDVLGGLLASILILRLGDYAIHLYEKYTKIEVTPSTDFVVIIIFISASLQVLLHKKRGSLKKKIEEERELYNKNKNE